MPLQNPNFQTNIQFPAGLTVGTNGGVASMAEFQSYYSNATHNSMAIQGVYNGISLYGWDAGSGQYDYHDYDLLGVSFVAYCSIQGTNLTDTGSATGSGSVASPTQDVTGINVSALPDGTLDFSVTLTNADGNTGNAATTSTTLDKTAPGGYTITANQR